MFEEQKAIDQNLYSCQLATFGLETQEKLIKMTVFIRGLRGLGIEIAKNLILLGPNSIVLHDNSLVELHDLSSNFYLNEQDVGKLSRCEAIIPQLKDLNPYINVSPYTGEITNQFLKQFDVAVFTDFFDLNKLFEFNEFCRSQVKPIGFILAGSLGLYGFTFVDFGNFKVLDKKGEELLTKYVKNISKGEKGVVKVYDEHNHNNNFPKFNTGDKVTFSNVQGMEEINGKIFEIKVLTDESFYIGDTTKFSDYKGQGIVFQAKTCEDIQFKKLETSLLTPNLEKNITLENTKYLDQLHLTLNGLFHYYKTHSALPNLNQENDAEELVHIVKLINEQNKKNMDNEGLIKLEIIDEKLVKNVAYFARAQISPCTSFWGAIVAQEVIKFTGKYTPLNQWLHYDNFESLPETKVDRTLTNNRYDDVIAIYGRELFKRLQTLKYFF